MNPSARTPKTVSPVRSACRSRRPVRSRMSCWVSIVVSAEGSSGLPSGGVGAFSVGVGQVGHQAVDLVFDGHLGARGGEHPVGCQ